MNEETALALNVENVFLSARNSQEMAASQSARIEATHPTPSWLKQEAGVGGNAAHDEELRNKSGWLAKRGR